MILTYLDAQKFGKIKISTFVEDDETYLLSHTVRGTN